jgi:spore coat polysaccharide biosynthesis protein SpsF
MRTIACIIARTNSTRLPQKVLLDINGLMMIEHIINSAKRCNHVDQIYICTSTHPDDQILSKVSKDNDISYYAGSEESVIDRMLEVAEIENASNVIRITADNIFTDSVYLDIMIENHILNDSDYTRVEYLPLGVTAEVMKVDALKKCYTTMDPNYSQYLMIYIFQPEMYNCLVLIPPEEHRHPEWNLTVDYPKDLERTRNIFEHIELHKSYDDLVCIIGAYTPKNIEYGATGIVKFPAKMVFYFETYRKEMELRIKGANQTRVSIEEYKQVAKAQSY